jgi:hypothetical protein
VHRRVGLIPGREHECEVRETSNEIDEAETGDSAAHKIVRQQQ